MILNPSRKDSNTTPALDPSGPNDVPPEPTHGGQSSNTNPASREHMIPANPSSLHPTPSSEMFRSPRLTYRALEPSDEAFLVTLASDSSARINSSSALPLPPGSSNAGGYRAFLNSCTLTAVAYLSPLTTTTTSSPFEADSPIGIVTLQDPGASQRHHRHARLGIGVEARSQNRGYGREMMEWALDWAFRRAGLNRVFLDVMGYNERAAGLYQRLGFVLEGRMREHLWHDGRFWDVLTYGLLEREWRSGRGEVGGWGSAGE